MTHDQLQRLCLTSSRSLRDAVSCLDGAGVGIVLVVAGADAGAGAETSANRAGPLLLGTITDGDIRRALLAGRDLDTTVGEFVRDKRNPVYPQPVLAGPDTPVHQLLAIMQARKIRHLPLVNDAGEIVDLVTLDQLMPQAEAAPLEAIIMAGGMGTRLRELTRDTPKPMLPVGGRPLLERTVHRLRQAGVRHVSVTTCFKPEKLMEHFRDGQDFGVRLDYINEPRPMGTAGALTLMPRPTQPVLIINGDILTSVDFDAMFKFHREQEATLTVAVRKYEFSVPYGVIESDGSRVKRLVEKPTYSSFVNAGIYLLEPSAYDLLPTSGLPAGQRLDMTDLVARLLEAGRNVTSFPIHEYWLDIGQPDDYARANADVRDGTFG